MPPSDPGPARAIDTPRAVVRRWALRAAVALALIDLTIWLVWVIAVTVWQPPEALKDGLREVAIVFLITASITTIFEWMVMGELAHQLGIQLTETAQQLGNQLTETATAILESTAVRTQELSQSISAIYHGATASGIVDIFVSRKDPRAADAIVKEIANTRGEVLLAGVGLPEYFGHPDTSKFYAPLFTQLSTGRITSVRVLLLDPDTRSANERNEIEVEFPADKVIRDSGGTIDRLRLRRFNIERRYYDSRPIAFIFCTDRYLFLEQYHCGTPRDSTLGSNIGSRVPLLQYDSSSPTYETMRSHFDHLWARGEATEKAKSLTRDFIRLCAGGAFDSAARIAGRTYVHGNAGTGQFDMTGVERLLGVVRRAVPDFEVVIGEQTIDDDGSVHTTVTARGTHQRDILLDVPGTGRQFDLVVTVGARVIDGLIDGTWTDVTVSQLRRALGRP